MNTLPLILEIVKEKLFDHFDNDQFEHKLKLFVTLPDSISNTLTVSYVPEGKCNEIGNKDNLDDILQKYITNCLEKHNKVIVYSCRDNYNISIEDPLEYEDFMEDLEETDVPELKGILYFSFD